MDNLTLTEKKLQEMLNNDPLGLLNTPNKPEDVLTCLQSGALSVSDLDVNTLQELALYLHKPESVDINTFALVISRLVKTGFYTEELQANLKTRDIFV